jgi:hypothetical protein
MNEWKMERLTQKKHVFPEGMNDNIGGIHNKEDGGSSCHNE